MARYPAQQLADLRAAIAEGVMKVRFSDGREMTYRSLAEMRAIERDMAAELETGQWKPRRIYAAHRRA